MEPSGLFSTARNGNLRVVPAPHPRPADGICRDCLTPARAAGRCRSCGSPRLLRHPELNELTIAHLDCDAFYAAIEKRDDPSLADKPVIVGGGKRGVVSTACYIARTYGVRSAMPMFQALKACPDAVVVKPNMEKYVAVGREVRAMMLALTPQVEPLSVDEAFMDLSGTEKLHGATPAMSLARLARRIEAEIGITVSIGLSFNKFLAKIASDLEKPRGFAVIGRAEAIAFLRDKPVGLIWGVGKAMQARLAADGIRTIATLQTMDEAELVRRYGVMGLRLARLSRADDTRSVDPRGEMKSVSAETTFDRDIADGHELKAILRALSEKVSRRLKKAELAGLTVTLKLKTADFKLRTRSRRLADPTRLADRIFTAGSDLLANEIDGTRFRLIGIGVSDFAELHLADPGDLVDTGAGKRAAAEAAMDRIRGKFGNDAVELGLVFDRPRRER
jgi:DNA polymerase-4